MNRTRSWSRVGALLAASILIIAATPSCLTGHCSMMGSHESAMADSHGPMPMTHIAAPMDCCTDSCPMREPDACETIMQADATSNVPSTAAVSRFELDHASVPVVAIADSSSELSRPGQFQKIELDALDSSPPTHLLNSQFLI